MRIRFLHYRVLNQTFQTIPRQNLQNPKAFPRCYSQCLNYILCLYKEFYLELFSIIPNSYNLVFSFDIHPTTGEGEICNEYSIVHRTGQNHFRTYETKYNPLSLFCKVKGFISQASHESQKGSSRVND